MTASTAVRAFVGHLEANGYSQHMVRAYQCDLNGLERFCRERGLRLERIAHGDLDDFLRSSYARCGPSGRRRSDGALNRARTSLRSLFRWLHETGQTATNPAARVRTGRCQNKPPTTISPRDEAKLLRALDASADPLGLRDRAVVRLLVHTGLRVGEVVALDVDGVDLRSHALVVRTKGGDVQQRYLPRAVRPALRVYMRWRLKLGTQSPALFVSGSGNRITSRHFRRRLSQWLAEAGVDGKVTPHSFRHTLATRLLDATGNLRLVQQALGHRSISSTIRYTRVPSKTLIAALERV